MSDITETVIDQWQIVLGQKKEQLQRCQQEKNVESCMKCDFILECELREIYVKAVYESMNKGSGGGFEF